jgi:putative endonuclease
VEKVYSVYILANQRSTVLYTGVTGDLRRGFNSTGKSYCQDLLTATTSPSSSTMRWEAMHPAIAREKQIKAGSRRKKIELINQLNPERRDLYADL